uniref:Uncharacterized protein n=1 Tax=Triticum urartu TaxID=4572 RepID=A0A8R7R2X6_TRIUA
MHCICNLHTYTKFFIKYICCRRLDDRVALKMARWLRFRNRCILRTHDAVVRRYI